MASAINPVEPTEDRRIREEKALYHCLKEYLSICNAAGTNDQASLDIVASGYELKKYDFVFVIYTKKGDVTTLQTVCQSIWKKNMLK